MNPGWLSSDLWFRGQHLGTDRIITASSAFSMQEKRAGEWFRFVAHREDLMCPVCSKSGGKTFTPCHLNLSIVPVQEITTRSQIIRHKMFDKKST